VIGSNEASIEARLEAIEHYRALGDTLREGDLRARLPATYVGVGRNGDAEAASLHAIELLKQLPAGPELTNAYSAQASLRMLNRDNADGVEWGRLRKLGARTRAEAAARFRERWAAAAPKMGDPTDAGGARRP
jgi:hypothetical protein